MVGAKRTARRAAGKRLLGHDRGVGERRQPLVDHQGDLEDGLAVRLVPAGKGTTGVRRLHLGGGHDVLCPRIVRKVLR